MMTPAAKPITGYHVAAIFVFGFTVIIGVNLTLAFNAVRTFPGTEVKNSYVASQAFDKKRSAQLALDWQVGAVLEDDILRLSIVKDGEPVRAQITKALFGRATHTGQDQFPEFEFNGTDYVAPVKGGKGNWNLRLKALAPNGTSFEQRIIVGAKQ